MGNVRNLRPQTLFEGFGGFEDPGFERGSPDLNNDPGIYRDVPGMENIDPGFQFGFERPTPTAGPQDYGGSPGDEFAPQARIPPQTAAPNGPTRGFADIFDQMNRQYTPRTESADRLNNLLNHAPEINTPSIGRTIAAGMMGFRQDPKVAQAELFAPYLRDMAAWKEKTAPFQAAATSENTGNVNERNLVGSMATTAMNMAKLESGERIAAEKARISEIRARAADFKARGYTIKVLGDEVVGFSADGHRVSLGSSGGLDEADKFDMESQRQIANINARTSGAESVAAIRGTVLYQDSAGNQYAHNPAKPGLTPIGDAPDNPVGSLSKVGTPSQNRTTSGGGGTGTGGTTAGGGKTNTLEDNRVRQAKMLDLYDHDPIAKKYLTKGSNNLFTMAERPVEGEHYGFGSIIGRGSVVTAEDVANWDMLKAELYPGYKPPVNFEDRPKAAPPAVTTTPNEKGIGPKTAIKVPPSGPLPGQVISAEDRTRAAIRTGITDANKDPKRLAELDRLLDDPKTPNQLRPAIQRERDQLHDRISPPVDVEQKGRAIRFLESHGKNVTEAAIQGVIDQGWVQ